MAPISITTSTFAGVRRRTSVDDGRLIWGWGGQALWPIGYDVARRQAQSDRNLDVRRGGKNKQLIESCDQCEIDRRDDGTATRSMDVDEGGGSGRGFGDTVRDGCSQTCLWGNLRAMSRRQKRLERSVAAYVITRSKPTTGARR